MDSNIEQNQATAIKYKDIYTKAIVDDYNPDDQSNIGNIIYSNYLNIAENEFLTYVDIARLYIDELNDFTNHIHNPEFYITVISQVAQALHFEDLKSQKPDCTTDELIDDVMKFAYERKILSVKKSINAICRVEYATWYALGKNLAGENAWTQEQLEELILLVSNKQYRWTVGRNAGLIMWQEISNKMGTKTKKACERKYEHIKKQAEKFELYRDLLAIVEEDEIYDSTTARVDTSKLYEIIDNLLSTDPEPYHNGPRINWIKITEYLLSQDFITLHPDEDVTRRAKNLGSGWYKHRDRTTTES